MINKNKEIPKNIDTSLKLIYKTALGDTGGSRRCAQFLLSLWNGSLYRCDLQELMYIDTNLFYGFLLVYQYLYKNNKQLYSIMSEDEIKPIIKRWSAAFSVQI